MALAFLTVARSAALAGNNAIPPPETSYDQLLDIEVTYDNMLARGYDDGYRPEASQQFQEVLAPFGEWFDEPSFGRVWRPSPQAVGADFVPYLSNGRWALTEYGWTWDSGWDWGWAPFHYGRWVVLAGRGWCWVPGTLWSPAWVSWRAGRFYVGWAALPPRGISLARPVDLRSPWRFTRLSNFGGPISPADWSARVLTVQFGRMIAISNERLILAGDLVVHVNAGPTRVGAVIGSPKAVQPIGVAAPGALPRIDIKPHPGAALLDRPWVKAGIKQQINWERRAPRGAVSRSGGVLPPPPLRDGSAAPAVLSTGSGAP